MKEIRFFIISAFCLLFFSNSCSLHLKSRDKTEVLTQKAIFEYLEKPNIYFESLTIKGLINIDPLLCLRSSISMNGKIYFNEPMYSNLLKYPLPTKKYHLTIPESLAYKYTYTGEDKDYEHDYAIIHQFSPLLPTKESNVYFVEYHIWAISCGEKVCTRALDRQYLKFKVEKENVTFIEEVTLYNQIDFIGFGGFSKKKMDEALPGEKIVRFGY